MRRQVNKFSDEFKLKVAKEYLSTSVSQKELKEKYGFSGNDNISRWMKQFGLKQPNESDIILIKEMTKSKAKSRREGELESKIEKLEKQLELSELKTRALDTMINIAERDMNIAIRKKPGPKQ